MTLQIQEMSQLVKHLGSHGFDQSFFRFMEEVVPIAQCTIFQLPSKGKPKVVMAQGQSSIFDRTAKRLAAEYVDGFLADDPHAFAYKQQGSSSLWQLFEPDSIENDKYRSKFYEQPRLTSELTLPIHYPDGILIASLYRSTSQGSFTQSEMNSINEVGDLCSALIERHVQSLKLDFTDSVEKRSDRFRRILHILLDCKLSPREAEICTLILMGHTTCGIGLELNISENTVGTHRKRAYSKLGIATQNELFCRCFDVVGEQG
jgi:DNA-binding CsgD family transcriptional regulator